MAVRVLQGLSAELLCTVQVGPDFDVADLKFEIRRLCQLPETEQRLLSGGRLLADHEELQAALGLWLPDAGSPGGLPEVGAKACVDVVLVRVDPTRARLLCDLRAGKAKLRDADEQTRHDREAVLAAVQAGGGALEHAGEELRGDREVVSAAVLCHGPSLQHASAALRGDRRIVLSAVSNDGFAIRYAAEALLQDHDILIAALRQNGWVLELLPVAQRAVKVVALAAVQSQGQAYEHVADCLKRDREVILAALENNGEAFHDVPEDLRSDIDFIQAAARGCSAGDFGIATSSQKVMFPAEALKGWSVAPGTYKPGQK